MPRGDRAKGVPWSTQAPSSQERIAMERQRSVNVIINTAVDQAAIAEIRRQTPGSSVAICGGDCVAQLVCRAVEMGGGVRD